MKIEIVVKHPDALEESIKDALNALEVPENLTEDEFEETKDARVEEYKKMASKWWEYGEYVTLVFDTDAQTMTVKEL